MQVLIENNEPEPVKARPVVVGDLVITSLAVMIPHIAEYLEESPEKILRDVHERIDECATFVISNHRKAKKQKYETKDISKH